MIVMKFGGSSVADADRIRRVAEIVRKALPRKPVLVVSALRGVTDDLLALAKGALTGDESLLEKLEARHEDLARELGLPPMGVAGLLQELGQLTRGIALVRELTPRTLDYAASFGERLSARLIAGFLARSGVPAEAVDAHKAGLLTDGRYGQSEPLPEADAALRRGLARIRVLPVMTGFIGRGPEGDITTLGRNGSDYTAAIVGAALGAREIQIWSDTDGVMTADPRVVPSAKPLPSLSFAEASELAYYGGKVLHPQTLVPAMRRNIPVRVLNTFKPEHPGTLVLAKPRGGRGVKSIAFKRRQLLVTLSSPRMLMRFGFLARIFETFARHEISVNMVSTSEVTVSLTTDSARGLDAAVKELKGAFTVAVEEGKAAICVVGEGISSTPGVAAEVFGAVKEAGVNVLMISQGASKINVAFLVDEKAVPAAVSSLHRRFFGA